MPHRLFRSADRKSPWVCFLLLCVYREEWIKVDRKFYGPFSASKVLRVQDAAAQAPRVTFYFPLDWALKGIVATIVQTKHVTFVRQPICGQVLNVLIRSSPVCQMLRCQWWGRISNTEKHSSFVMSPIATFRIISVSIFLSVSCHLWRKSPNSRG